MIPLRHIEQETIEEDGEIEVYDLDLPGNNGSSISSWFASTLLHRQHSPYARRYKRYWRLASAPSILLLLLLFSLSRGFSLPIASGFKTTFHSPSRPSLAIGPLPAPPLPPRDGIACLADAAWSPDSHFIAVLGYQACPKGNHVLGLLNLYDARSKHLLRQLKPDNVISHALTTTVSPPPRRASGKQPPPGLMGADSMPPIAYEYDCASGHKLVSILVHATAPAPLAHAIVMRWSPDGSRLLLSSVPWGLVSLWNLEHLL